MGLEPGGWSQEGNLHTVKCSQMTFCCGLAIVRDLVLSVVPGRESKSGSGEVGESDPSAKTIGL